ncbi:MAG: macro domain-containing protein [Blautia sp.]|nr:macro domain-containing protein [Blautia sp.]
MPFKIVRDDITRMRADAIVNTANPEPVIGNGTDRAIYQAAGEKELLAERGKIGKIERGQAAVTPAFRLSAKYIIHTVGPVWKGGEAGETEILSSCYENSLKLAKKYGCESIAFPLISTGIYGFPKDLALQTVLRVVSSFLMEDDMMIYLVVFSPHAVRLSEKIFSEVEDRIDDTYVSQKNREEYPSYFGRRTDEGIPFGSQWMEEPDDYFGNYPSPDTSMSVWGEPDQSQDRPTEKKPVKASASPFRRAAKEPVPLMRRLKDLIGKKDETFQQMLLRLITEKGLTNAQAYKRANQDKKLFSKIKNDVNYQPKKKTVLAFALALELNMDETRDLLARAGYAFSPSSNFDKAIQFFIETKEYNIYEIEIILYDLGLESLCNY